jgi:uracil-DNA glycosylase
MRFALVLIFWQPQIVPPRIKSMKNLDTLLDDIRRCYVCAHATPPMPREPRPILRAHRNSKIRIISQAPGNLAFQSGVPFSDPSGVRLRDWLGVNEATFYDARNFAITPIGFCFPGYDKNGGDLPPRKECAPLWQESLSESLQRVELTLLVGGYAQKHVLGKTAKPRLTDTVQNWRDYGPDVIPLPHPSWRNNSWIKKNDWFEDTILELKHRVEDLVERA